MSASRPDFAVLAAHMSRRLEELASRVRAGDRRVADELLAELSASLEELHVASDELQEQAQRIEAATQQMDAERQRYTELFELVTDGYLVTDAHGIILEANEAARRLVGGPPGRITGRPFSPFLAPAGQRAMFSTLAELTRHPGVRDLEVEILPRHGPPRAAWVRAAGATDPEQGTPTVRWILRDISERVADEIRLERANQFKDALLLAVSHELRTPVAAVAALLDVLRDHADQLSAEETTKAHASMRRSIREVQSVVANLLDVDRLGRDRVERPRQPTDVAELVERCVTGMGLAERVQRDVDPVVARLDPGLTERILDNLLANADRFSPEGSAITVHAHRHGREGILLQVDDRGPGIPEANRESVFELFTHGSPGAGSGVGLYLVRQFAELHDGRAWIDATPEGGTAACVLLSEGNVPSRSPST